MGIHLLLKQRRTAWEIMPIENEFVTESAIYAATSGGLSCSIDGGTTFQTLSNMANTYEIYVFRSKINVATTGSGFYIFNDRGSSFSQKTSASNGLGNNNV